MHPFAVVSVPGLSFYRRRPPYDTLTAARSGVQTDFLRKDFFDTRIPKAKERLEARIARHREKRKVGARVRGLAREEGRTVNKNPARCV